MMLTKNKFKKDYIKMITSKTVKNVEDATPLEKYIALASTVRGYITEYWLDTNKKYLNNSTKQVYYLSIEYLMGKLLVNNLLNLGIKEVCQEGLKELGIELCELEELEKDQGLGNGGLGRLAACFLDSMASLQIPGHGYGIRYKYGLFEQKIINGYQVEYPDRWLEKGNVWEIKKTEDLVEIKFGGNVKVRQENNELKFSHENYDSILAIPYDTPIVGYNNNIVNTLRLWSAEETKKDFDYELFNRGEYTKSFEHKYSVGAISSILYPDDSYFEGRILRLKQEYFFVSASIQDIIRSFKKLGKSIKELHKYVAIHINDTHPALAIPELMRILIDEENLGWDQAWKITQNTISYTNHTIMAEAMENWSIHMFKTLLPRIYMIVEEINERFCKEILEEHADSNKINEVAIIADGMIKMAYLAIVGSCSINGVAELHSEILKKRELKNFYHIYPYKFNNKTNGINHRRWLLKSNPKLSNLISDTIGSKWIEYPQKLVGLLEYKKDKSFQEQIKEIKQYNKNKLAQFIKQEYSIDVNTNSIFDIQAKRIHEYKRQVLNVLHVMYLYNRIIENPQLDIVPRTFIFSGKAAPGYFMAKKIIKLINTLADKVNNDNRVKDKLKVIFIRNYGVSLAELMIPAANVSEQISTTTMEASGTGNMKFMMNGAITIATLDGANIEIENAVGQENIIIFGLKERDISELYRSNSYNSVEIYNQNIKLKIVLDQLINGFFPGNNDEFYPIYDALLKYNDKYFVLKDFNDYLNAHSKIDNLYRDDSKWLEMSICNIAHSGIFSSDKTIYRYSTGIWDVESMFH